MIYDVIYSLLASIEKLVFFNKQLLGFITSLRGGIASFFLKLFCSDQYIVLVTYNTCNSILEFMLLVFCNKVTLSGRIVNICDAHSQFK